MLQRRHISRVYKKTCEIKKELNGIQEVLNQFPDSTKEGW